MVRFIKTVDDKVGPLVAIPNGRTAISLGREESLRYNSTQSETMPLYLPRGQAMQMVKIHIPERSDRAKALETLTLRGRVICLPDNIFIVPEPALEVLQSLTVAF